MPRPPFKPVKPGSTGFATPEELFYKLSSRQSSHGYLRGPQQDVLREYAEKFSKAADVAFELPTGTGKTAVGLIVAEWKRLAGNKAAYLSLTNQLAGQALEESKRLGIPCADLRGAKDTRSPLEEGRYRTGEAVAVTTYANLFNVNPVLRESDLIVLDDAHGAEQYVADMWTVSANVSKDEHLYNSLLAALRPGLSESQVRSILDKSAVSAVEMVDVLSHPECITNAISVLDQTMRLTT
jgi:ERCC4-related helicase